MAFLNLDTHCLFASVIGCHVCLMILFLDSFSRAQYLSRISGLKAQAIRPILHQASLLPRRLPNKELELALKHVRLHILDALLQEQMAAGNIHKCLNVEH